MTWWWRTVRAAWDRWDEWRYTPRILPDGFDWFGEMRDLPDRELGPGETPKRPGKRYVGKHRLMPDEPVRRPS